MKESITRTYITPDTYMNAGRRLCPCGSRREESSGAAYFVCIFFAPGSLAPLGHCAGHSCVLHEKYVTAFLLKISCTLETVKKKNWSLIVLSHMHCNGIVGLSQNQIHEISTVEKMYTDTHTTGSK